MTPSDTQPDAQRVAEIEARCERAQAAFGWEGCDWMEFARQASSDDIPYLLSALRNAEARYREAVAALKGCDGIIADAQMMLAEHLPPDGPSEKTTINRLLELMDGPHQRKVADDTNTVLAEAARRAAAILAQTTPPADPAEDTDNG